MDPGENHHENEKKTESCAADGGLPVGMAGGRGLSARQLALADASGARAAAGIGCGKGRFTVETAAAGAGYVLFVAVERVQEALVVAMEKARELGLRNVFLWTSMWPALKNALPPVSWTACSSTSAIPGPGKKNAKRRLTHRGFLEKYSRVLTPGDKFTSKRTMRLCFNFPWRSSRPWTSRSSGSDLEFA